MKENEKVFLGVCAPRTERLRFWSDRSGGDLSDFAVQWHCANVKR